MFVACGCFEVAAPFSIGTPNDHEHLSASWLHTSGIYHTVQEFHERLPHRFNIFCHYDPRIKPRGNSPLRGISETHCCGLALIPEVASLDPQVHTIKEVQIDRGARGVRLTRVL